MRLVAVVPTWRGSERLPAVIAALGAAVAAVVVVENESPFHSQPANGRFPAWLGRRPASFEAGPAVHCLPAAENRGFAAAVNRGIEWSLTAGAEAVLLVNDDAFFQPGAVEPLVQELELHPEAAATCAHLCYSDRPWVLNGAGGTVDRRRGWAALRGDGEPDDGRYAKMPIVDYPSGAACLIRREALERVGLFDEAYFLYYEDADWGLRAREAGYTIRYVPEARVLHIGCASTRNDAPRRRYYNVRNRLRFAARHTWPEGFIWAWLATLILLAKQPLRWPSKRRQRDAEAVFWAVLDHLRRRYGRSPRFG